MDCTTFITRIEPTGFKADTATEYWLGNETGLRLDADGGVALLDLNGVPAAGRLRYDDAHDLVQTRLTSGDHAMRYCWESVVSDRNTRQPRSDVANH